MKSNIPEIIKKLPKYLNLGLGFIIASATGPNLLRLTVEIGCVYRGTSLMMILPCRRGLLILPFVVPMRDLES